MSILHDVIEKTPPKVLYHYIGHEGLLGILRDQQIWATHSQFLNDAREFHHARLIAERELATARKAITNDDKRRRILAEMVNTVARLDTNDAYVCSFSAADDLLSQWRAYGDPTSGFAIGIDASYLSSQPFRNAGFFLLQCLYSAHRQRLFIREAISRTFAHVDAKQSGLGKVSRTKYTIIFKNALKIYSPILKDPTFSEEKEWRLVAVPTRTRSVAIRPGRPTLVPYVKVALPRPQIVEIVVGPTPLGEHARRAIDLLRSSYGLKFDIRASRVPYRRW